jgi:peroxiredoxin/uncharacterized membrane protein YphA (DoxX/SURF4 family)
MELILLLLRLLLAGILGLAGIGKLLDPDGGEKVMTEFGVPSSIAKAAAIALSLFEILLALALLSTSTSWIGAVAAFLLMLVFIGGMLWQIAKGRAPDCHCFGQLHSEPVSKKSVIRNIVFAAPALVLAFAGPSFQGYSLSDPQIDSAQNLFGILSVALFAAVLIYLRRISKQQSEILRRLQLLELMSADGGAVERNEAGDPNDSLPIGGLFPDFALADLTGTTVQLSDLLNTNPQLFLFVDAACVPCSVLLPELDEWERELKGKIDFVYISRGTVDENIFKFGEERALLLQQDKELSAAVFARWTPSALLMSSEGRVMSHVAVGDQAIRDLILSMKNADPTNPLLHFPIANGNGIRRKIGQKIPEFSLEDMSGRKITNETLQDQSTLVTFWSPGCPHCRELISEIKDTEKRGLPDGLGMVIFSDGDPETHADLGLRLPIVLDKGFKVSAQMGITGTPSAVLVDEGVIVSETAVGGPNIWSLVRRAKV